MRKSLWVFLIAFFNTVNLAFTQQISVENALVDLNFLGKALSESHPSVFKDSISDEILKIQNELQEDSLISPAHFRILLGRVLNEVHCVHTYINDFQLPIHNKSLIFPFPVFFDGEKLYQMDTLTHKHKIISEINGVSTADIMRDLLRFRSGDGKSNAFSKEYFNLFNQTILPYYFNFHREYSVVIDGKKENYISGANNCKIYKFPYYQKFSSKTLKFDYAINDSLSILKVPTFSGNLKREFRTFFKELSKVNSEALIIDLRGNSGGERSNGVELLRYLSDSSFSYKIVQSGIKPNKYFEGKANFQYFLSKVKYNIGNFYRSRRSGDGREFIYSYKPFKKNRFKGKIFVLTDGFTASTSTMFTSLLKQSKTEVWIVGRQTGGGYNSNNGGSFPELILPYSKCTVNFPLYRIITDENSQQSAGYLPDLPVNYGPEEITSALDLDLLRVLEFLKL